MATDYDAPRRRAEDELETDSLDALKSSDRGSYNLDDDDEIIDSYDIPTEDMSSEDLNVTVVPRRDDEFTCGSCFIVQRRNRIAREEEDGTLICMDCD